MDISGWSPDAASNNRPPPDGWPEGMQPSGVNDSAREMMAAIRRWWERLTPTLTSAGTPAVQTLTYATAPGAYVRGDVFTFFSGFTTTGPMTLNVNGLGPKLVRRGSVDLLPNAIVAGQLVVVAYDGTDFQVSGAAS